MATLPDGVTSAGAIGAVAFDEVAYKDLRSYYLEERMWAKELTDGIRLRQQPKPSRIDCENGPGWNALKCQIQKLETQKNHREIFRLLHQLCQYQQLKGQFPSVRQDTDDGPQEDCHDCTLLHTAVDLTDIPDEEDIIDVDQYIIDVLLVKAVKRELEEAGAKGLPVKKIKVEPMEEPDEFQPRQVTSQQVFNPDDIDRKIERAKYDKQYLAGLTSEQKNKRKQQQQNCRAKIHAKADPKELKGKRKFENRLARERLNLLKIQHGGKPLLTVVPPPRRTVASHISRSKLKELESEVFLQARPILEKRETEGPGWMMINKGRVEIFIHACRGADKESANKETTLADRIFSNVGIDKKVFVGYLEEKAKESKAPNLHPKQATYNGFCFIVTMGKARAQVCHADLLFPNFQCAFMVSDDVPGTVFYRTRKKVLETLHQFKEQGLRELFGENCWDGLKTLFEQDADIKKDLKLWGFLLAAENDPVGQAKVYPAGTLQVGPGSTVHCCPESDKDRCIVFFTGCAKNEEAYQSQAQWTALTLFGYLFEALWGLCGAGDGKRFRLFQFGLKMAQKDNDPTASDRFKYDTDSLRYKLTKLINDCVKLEPDEALEQFRQFEQDNSDSSE